MKKLLARFFRIFFNFLDPFLYFFMVPAALSLMIFRVRIIYNCKYWGFGHLGWEPSVLLKSVHLGYLPKYHFILIADKKPANEYLLRMWKSHVWVIDNPIAARLLTKVRLLKGLRIDVGAADASGAPEDIDQQADFVNDSYNRQTKFVKISLEAESLPEKIPNISFPEKDKEICIDALRQLGISVDDWFVCIHAREDMKYNTLRNNDIASFEKAIDFINRKGGKVVRLGYAGIPDPPKYMNLIDYPNSKYKSPMMDMFLLSRQRFFIGSQSGVCRVVELFDVPSVLTNILPWSQPAWRKTDLWLPKLIVDRKGRIMSLDEYFERKLHLIASGYGLHKDLDAIENSPEEILKTVEEMFFSLEKPQIEAPRDIEGSWATDHIYQDVWRRNFPKHHYAFWSQAKIGRWFMEKHSKSLLGLPSESLSRPQRN